MVEGVFPVVVNNQVAHILMTGPMKQDVWSEMEIATLARVFGVDAAVLARAVKGLPVYSAAQIDRWIDLHKSTARVAAAVARRRLRLPPRRRPRPFDGRAELRPGPPSQQPAVRGARLRLVGPEPRGGAVRRIPGRHHGKPSATPPRKRRAA
ncbi:MAG: hypothetical protein U1F87_15490 [Kiritimatiellia bacterium]